MKHSTIALTLLVFLLSTACSSPTPPPATLAAPSATAPAATASTPAGGATSAGATLAPPTSRPTLPATAASSATVVASATVTPTATADAAIAGGLVGLWQGNNNSFYLFNKDGTWNWDQMNPKVLTQPENQGRWWIEGDVIHIQDLSGTAPCPLNQVGAYQAQLSGDTLELAAVGDPCTVRIGQTSGTYARQAAGP